MLNEQNDFLGFSMSQTKHQANASASVIKDFDELRQYKKQCQNLGEQYQMAKSSLNSLEI